MVSLRDESLGATDATGPTVGVLALQGDFREHARVLGELGARVVLVRRPEDVEGIDGLVIPGGESTVMDKLSRAFGVAGPLKRRIADGLPVYGTCAGLIMIADTLLDTIDGQQNFGGLDVVVRRNAFGSQNESFETELSVPALGDEPVHAVFIRGPVVESVGENARPLAALADGRVVAVEQGDLIGTSFHPEIEGDHRFHEYFLSKVRAAVAAAA
ncbi:pyridoxal 5'-phosphate synthase glutaminase subunit PdxT [Agromyces sp. M3QZ16-3]|uniref:pyridoxal 5'-phosphate synthase glutaminase subunit PdxT n=1 Tax=Agromyces sp. M3QZ16-3 TaxID=3447585 RepID=UPI003F68CB5E